MRNVSLNLPYPVSWFYLSISPHLAAIRDSVSQSIHPTSHLTFNPYPSLVVLAARATLDAIGDSVLARLNSFELMSMAFIVGALARLKHRHGPLLAEAAPVIVASAARLAPADVADVAHAYRTFGLAPAGLFEALAACALENLDDFGSHLLRLMDELTAARAAPPELVAAYHEWLGEHMEELDTEVR